MRYMAFVALFLFSDIATSDECVNKVESYLSSLRGSLSLQSINNKQKEYANSETQRILSLRKQYNDCIVSDEIDKIVNSHKSINRVGRINKK